MDGRNLSESLQGRNICPAMFKLAEELNALRHPGALPLTAPMLVQTSTGAHSPVGSLEQPTPRVAVLLNARARKVTPRVVRALSHVVPRSDLYLSRSEKD